MVRTAAIISKPAKPELHQVGAELVEWLLKQHYTVVVDVETSAYVQGQRVCPRERIAQTHPEFAVVLGGDGTLLAAARSLAPAGIPILGVNLGSLGFLTEVPLAELYATLEAVHHGHCGTESRAMVHAEVWRDGEVAARYDALNDVVLNKSALARLVSFDLAVDGTYVSNYKADGVIIATPTGSTAYSLAAGGPIVMPSADTLVITPVCSHSLTGRPLVVRDTATIEIVVRNVDEDAFLTADGQVGLPVIDGDTVVCRQSDFRVKLLRLRKTFFEVLRTKLKWGER